MFASETLLKNCTIATLELCKLCLITLSVDNNQPRWWTKDAILTDHSFYLFLERGDILGE